LERLYRLSRGLVQIIARIQGAGRILICYLGGERAQHQRRECTSLGGRQVGEWRWIKSLPGKGWFTYFRLMPRPNLYSDKSWVLPDITLAAN
jgi:hypothetical protein